MKAFSPVGPAVKAFYGYSRDTGIGAKTIGNPSGLIFAPPSPGGALNVFIPGSVFGRSFLSDFMTPQQQADWQAGLFSVMNVSAGGNPPLGYWVLAGATSTLNPATSDFSALLIDLDPGIDVDINLDSSKLRFYGPPGWGSSQPSVIAAGIGGDAILISTGSVHQINLNITNTNGANTGRIFGGGGGGGRDAGIGGAGGSGAGGWFQNWADTAQGATRGGIYDSNNGGANNPNVAGGLGNVLGKNGGGLGVAGGAGTGDGGGPAGLAVRRLDPGVTVIVSGGGSNFIRGAVQ